MNSNARTAHASDTTALPPSQAPATQQPELLTQVQMAQRLGITRRTLHTWVRSGTVPMIKVRGYCRFEYAKVLAALQQHEVPADLPNASALRRVTAPAPQTGAAPSAPESSSSSPEGTQSAETPSA